MYLCAASARGRATAHPGQHRHALTLHTSARLKVLRNASEASAALTDVEGEVADQDEEEELELEEIRAAQHWLTVPDFLHNANALRGTFDSNFCDQRKVRNERFCWDYWHVPGQYTLLRTPAQDYFDPAEFKALETALLDYGRDKLGCTAITPIWLSYYVDGCGQELHCDNAHGPWAFVVSLTHWSRRSFRGGETAVLTDCALNFWSHFSAGRVVERQDLMTLVEPSFNQLTLFDPRLPHGVREVRGVQEPTEARVVLTGWFLEPELLVEGGLSFKEASEVVMLGMELFEAAAEELPGASGALVLRIAVAASGTVDAVEILVDTLVPRPHECGEAGPALARALLQHAVVACFQEHTYPPKAAPSTVTMPVMFD